MKTLKKIYKGHTLDYSFKPGEWMTDVELINLKQSVQYVNRLSNKNLTYGALNPNISIEVFREFLCSTNICLIFDKTEPIGLFYNILIQDSPFPVIHAGLVLIGKNKGIDLISVPYAYLTYFQWKKYGAYYYTNMSSTPSIVGTFGYLYKDVWPSAYCNQLKPPNKEYTAVLEMVYQKYVEKYFPGENKLDKKRFVVQSQSKEMGFETDFRKLPRYSKQEVNLFCTYWLNYAKGEDLLQVGKVDALCAMRLRVITLLHR